MKKKYFLILAIAALIATLFIPFVIKWLYEIGKTFPLIVTPYTESDMLDYSATIISLAISVIALIQSIQVDDVRFRISHATTFDSNDQLCIQISIINDSSFECPVSSVSITNKKHNHSAHIVAAPPFNVNAKSSKDFDVPTERVKRVIALFQKEKHPDKLFYQLYLGTGERIYLRADELLQTLKMQEDHIKRFGSSEIEERKPYQVVVHKKKTQQSGIFISSSKGSPDA